MTIIDCNPNHPSTEQGEKRNLEKSFLEKTIDDPSIDRNISSLLIHLQREFLYTLQILKLCEHNINKTISNQIADKYDAYSSSLEDSGTLKTIDLLAIGISLAGTLTGAFIPPEMMPGSTNVTEKDLGKMISSISQQLGEGGKTLSTAIEKTSNESTRKET